MIASIFLALPLAAPRSAQVFYIDGSGPADFPGIVEAIASPLVSSGDTLLVAGGSYASFVLDKPLHILPVAGQGFSVPSVSVSNVPFFSLVGAGIKNSLTVTDVRGRGLIDRCSVSHVEITVDYFYHVGETQVTNCDELLIQRSNFRGTDACYTYGSSEASHAMDIWGSTVVLSNCTLRGGDEAGLDCPTHYPTSGSGLDVKAGSNVLIVDSTLIAGYASTIGGIGKLAAVNVTHSDVVIRGNTNSYLQASLPLHAIEIDATSTATVSGVTLNPPGLPAVVLSPLIPEPFLRASGGVSPGGTLVVDLFGPLGAPAAVAIATNPALLQIPMFSNLLWLKPAGIVSLQPLVTAGQERPSGLSIAIPADPAFIGFTVTIQALVGASGSSGPWLTNPFGVLLGG